VAIRRADKPLCPVGLASASVRYLIARRLWRVLFVDVWKLLKGFWFRSPAGSAPRLTARAPCQRQHPIVHDRCGPGRYSSRCVPIRQASPGNSPPRSRDRKATPATPQQRLRRSQSGATDAPKAGQSFRCSSRAQFGRSNRRPLPGNKAVNHENDDRAHDGADEAGAFTRLVPVERLPEKGGHERAHDAKDGRHDEA